MASTSLHLQALHLEHRQLAALGAHLLSDEHGGEDLAQEAAYRWELSREQGIPWRGEASPGSGARIAWLRKTARRLAFNERRGGRHRRDREQSVARTEATPSTREIAERAELCRRLHAAVDMLPEEHAGALRDHYFGGLSAGEIAARDGLSVHTIKSRIQRSRTALRRVLERRGLGGDMHWAVALLPLVPLDWRRSAVAGGPPSAAGGSLAATAVGWKIVLLWTALVAGGAMALYRLLPPGTAPGEAAWLDRPAMAVVAQPLPSPVASENALRRPGLAASAVSIDPTSKVAPSLGAPTAALRVTSAAGIPLEAAYFQSAAGAERERMDRLEDGRFALPADGEVSAPGHRPQAALWGDESLQLEPAGLLIVEYPGLRAGCVRVDLASLDESMLKEAALGFLSNDAFAIAVASYRWPNYNLRAEPRLLLRGGRTLGISFLPLGDTRGHVVPFMEPEDLLGEVGVMEIVPSLAGQAVEGRWNVTASLQLPADIAIGRQRVPGGSVMVVDSSSQSAAEVTGPGPWQLENLLIGRTYRVSALGADGAYGEALVEFDGEPLTLELAPPTSLLATIRDDAGTLLPEVHVTALIPPAPDEGHGVSLWRGALAAGVLCSPVDGRHTLPMPYGSPAAVDSGVYRTGASQVVPMPGSVRLRISAPGHETRTIPATWSAAGVHDLGEWVLQRRNDGIEWVGRRPGELAQRSQLYWSDPVSGAPVMGSTVSIIPSGEDRAVLFMEDPSPLGDAWPDELFVLRMGCWRAVRVAEGRYRMDATIEKRVRFELDPALRADGHEVDLGIRSGDLTQTIYTFRREAIGTVRALDLVAPEEGAVVTWRMRSGSPSSPVLGPWRELGPLGSLSQVVLQPE